MHAPPESGSDRHPSLAVRAGAVAVLIAVTLFAYQGVWRGDWIFDDGPALATNDALRTGDWWRAAFGSVHTPLAGRPVTCVSLALDFAIWGDGPFGPHFGNLILHVANVLLVFAVANTALRAPAVGGVGGERRALALTTAFAASWAAHPLGVDAVAYATQRSTLLASVFALLAVLATLRRSASRWASSWSALAVGATAAAMASKEDAVVLPLLVVLAERAFVVADWSALRSRWRFHAGLAATWLVLAACVEFAAPNATVGWHTRSGVTAWQWLLTQAGVVVRYLQLVVWPTPLRGCYDLGITTAFGDAALAATTVVAVLVAVVVAWRRAPWAGWLGASFFLWLAPTSTILPIVTEIAAERRVYLPMASVLALLVLGVATATRRWPWLGALLGAAVVVGAALATRARVAVYGDPVAFWTDAYGKRSPGARTFVAGILLANTADAFDALGRADEAAALLDEAMLCDGPTTPAICRHALSLARRGRHREAVAAMQRLVASDPSPRASGTLGACLAAAHADEQGVADDPRLGAAAAALQPAVAALPHEAQFWSALGYVLRTQGRLDAAEVAYHRLTECEPVESAPYLVRADLLERLGRAGEVAPWMRSVLAAQPDASALHLDWAAWSVHHGDLAAARTAVAHVLAREPANARAAAMDRELRAMPQSR